MFNEDWYSDDQIKDLLVLLKSVRNIEGSVIEVGCWEGKSTISIANACYPDVVLCNDTWLGNVQESIITGQKHITEKILETRDVYSTFLFNMNAKTQGNFEVVKEDCIEWLKRYDGAIKFIHIDASHEYESVFETIQLALTKLVPGGVICGDDYLSANIQRRDLHGGVERAVKESLPRHHNIGNLWFYIKEGGF
jgi:predicted O-methyltransferase YrrM